MRLLRTFSAFSLPIVMASYAFAARFDSPTHGAHLTSSGTVIGGRASNACCIVAGIHCASISTDPSTRGGIKALIR